MKRINGVVFGFSARCGLYILTSEGEVYNLKDGTLRRVPLYKNSRGYLRFSYYGKWYTVHRAVYEAFIGTIPQGMVIDHIDEDRLNNRVDNLQVLTSGDNVRKHWALVKEGRV